MASGALHPMEVRSDLARRSCRISMARGGLAREASISRACTSGGSEETAGSVLRWRRGRAATRRRDAWPMPFADLVVRHGSAQGSARGVW